MRPRCPSTKNIFPTQTRQRSRTNIRWLPQSSTNLPSNIPTTPQLSVTRKKLSAKRPISWSRIILSPFRTRRWTWSQCPNSNAASLSHTAIRLAPSTKPAKHFSPSHRRRRTGQRSGKNRSFVNTTTMKFAIWLCTKQCPGITCSWRTLTNSVRRRWSEQSFAAAHSSKAGPSIASKWWQNRATAIRRSRCNSWRCGYAPSPMPFSIKAFMPGTWPKRKRWI